MTFTRGHRQCHPLVDLDFLSDTGNVGYTYFQAKKAEINLKIDQGHWQWNSSVGHISLSITGL